MRLRTQVRFPRTARARAVAAVAGLAVAGGAVVAAIPRTPPVPAPLTEGIAQDPCHPQDVMAVPPGVTGRYQPGSSVLRSGGRVYLAPGRFAPVTAAVAACARDSARASQRWLAAGIIPGTTAQQRSVATRALLDLRLSTRPNGAVIAGWHGAWRYSWPRDSSWVAVALADTDHDADALEVLRFLQRTQLPDGRWAARYWPDGSGPVRDGRPVEADADGWVPWAVWSWAAAAGALPAGTAAAGAGTAGKPGSAAARGELTELWPMVSAAAAAAADSLAADGLPAASMDYWEDSVETTLGTAAPLLAGLRAAADIAGRLGRPGPAQRWAGAAGTLSRAIQAEFGRYGYHRLPRDRSGADAAVTFLGPPFAAATTPVTQAVLRTGRALTLPGGGVLPGSAFPGNRTVAWTAETAFFALYLAGTGDHARSAAILSWLAAHRTSLGALPEQVNARGRPVSVAPLAWTDAVVLLALIAQRRPLPIPPSPAP
jgi:glucoamylase